MGDGHAAAVKIHGQMHACNAVAEGGAPGRRRLRRQHRREEDERHHHQGGERHHTRSIVEAFTY